MNGISHKKTNTENFSLLICDNPLLYGGQDIIKDKDIQ